MLKYFELAFGIGVLYIMASLMGVTFISMVTDEIFLFGVAFIVAGTLYKVFMPLGIQMVIVGAIVLIPAFISLYMFIEI